ncbi:MAG: hypothetical protein JRI89_17705, partial [Deltaproteobacteria bacterium]|nr:hypothetical protein [Deltaproteobacteria bacterium]
TEMAKFFGVSVNTFRDFPLDLQQHTLNRLLRERSNDGDGYIGVYAIGDRAMAFTVPDKPHIRCLPVLNAALTAVDPNEDRELKDFSLRRDGFSVNVMSDKAVDVADVGDITQGGIRLRHSDVGAFGTSLAAFLLRLICVNGLARASSVARGHFTSEDEFRAGAMVHDWATELYLELNEHLHAYELLAEIPLPAPYEAIEQLGERNGLSEECTEMVLDAYSLESELPHTMYRLTNALTYVSSHAEFDGDRQRRKLQNLADFLVGNGEDICPHCLSLN